MTSNLEDIRSKLPFKNEKNSEGIIDYKVICEIHRKIQENTSTVQSEIGRGQHGILNLTIQLATYQTVSGKEFQHPAHTPQAAPVPLIADAAEVPSYIQHHVDLVYQ